MTETQRKFLTEYLGGEWLPSFQFDVFNRTFTTAQDKQDLLERVIERGEWMEFLSELNDIWKDNLHFPEFSAWLIQLSPLETAELICRWKGIS